MDVLKFLERNVKPATGCTESVAIGYAVSLAYNSLFDNVPPEFGIECPRPSQDRVKGIHIKTDRDVYKNALAIAIPGTMGQKGMYIAVAMGLYCDPKKELNLFSDVKQDVIEEANGLLCNGKVKIEEVEDDAEKSELDIQITLEYLVDENTKKAIARLRYSHDNIEYIKVDEKLVYADNTQRSQEQSEQMPGSIADLVSIVEGIGAEEINEIYKGIEMNKRIAEEGLNSDYGLGHGKILQRLFTSRSSSDNLIMDIRVKAAAAGDARMGGANMPVMSTAGSGNQGITALIPFLVIGEKDSFNGSRDKISKAALLSHLVTRYVSDKSGYLSALCGCTIKAGIGAAAGVAYLLGGDTQIINNAINIMAANITGVICDGAKESCALKLSTAAGTATESALMALMGMKVPHTNGIVDDKAENTIKNIGRVSKAMVSTDLEIVRIMQDKWRKGHGRV